MEADIGKSPWNVSWFENSIGLPYVVYDLMTKKIYIEINYVYSIKYYLHSSLPYPQLNDFFSLSLVTGVFLNYIEQIVKGECYKASPDQHRNLY